jgi:xanthine/uracil permease
MDFLQTVNIILGVICIIIGLLLIPMSIWFMFSGIKNRDRVFIIIAVAVLVLAIVAFFGACNLFTSGIIRASPYMPR